MGKALNIIYGLLMIFVAVFALFKIIIPTSLLPFVVLALGALILITPLEGSGRQIYPGAYTGVSGIPRPAFQWLRRWVFGIYLILSSLASFVDIFANFPYLAYTSIYLFSGQLILFAIGVITFLLAIPRARNVQITSY